MHKFAKASLIFAIGATTICGLATIRFSNSNEKTEVVFATPHTGNFDLYDYQSYSGEYYSFLGNNLTEGLSGSLRTTLSSNILPKEWYSYSGSGTTTLSSILQEADEDPTNSNNMIYLYTRDSVKKNAASSWNREHTWPKNLSNGCWTESKAGSDMLHLRPTYPTPNSTRNNNKFAEISGGEKRTYSGMDFGYTSGSKFMPLDSAKGDVARIIMYVWVAYKDFYASMPNITNVFESYDTLLKWHTEDKPDVMEAHRNEVAENSLQKNRNPFVDHPEFAWKIFGDSCSASVKNACKTAYPETQQKKLESLTYIGSPNKTTYYTYENFDPTGLTVTATYDDKSTKNVTSEVKWSPLELGKTSVTGSYGGKTVTISGLTIKEPPTDVDGVSLNMTTATIKKNGFVQLIPTISPITAKNKNVSWSTSNPLVATVNASGLVVGVSEGTAIITVKTEDGNFTASCTVTVSGVQEDVTVEITRDSFESGSSYGWNNWSQDDVSGQAFIFLGEKAKMQFNKSKDGYAFFTNKTVGSIKSVTVKSQSGSSNWILYTSNSPYNSKSTTSGNSQGQKTATTSGVKWDVSNGDSYFSLSLDDSGVKYISSIIVEYSNSIIPPTPTVRSINLPGSLTINKSVSNVGTITPVVDADPGASYSISWSSSNSSVATVSGNNSSATVTALKTGTTTITASIGDLSDTCLVTVTENVVPPTPDPKVNSISLPKTLTIDLNDESTGTIVPIVDADEGATYTISWSSSNTSVATVLGTNSSATVTGLGEGTSIITATIGELSASCEVTVIPLDRIVEIVVNHNFKTDYKVGETFDPTGLVVTAHHLNGTDEDVTDAATIGNVDTSTVGKKTVEVTYLTFKTSFSITVLDKSVDRLILKKTPAKVQYFADEPFNPYGAVIQAVLEDESIIDNVVDQCNFEYNFEESNVVRYSFGGKSNVLAVVILTSEPTVEHKAADFAYTFNEKLEDVEAEDVTLEQWDSLLYDYNKLDDDSKEYLKTITTTSGEGEVSAGVSNEDALKQFAEKYDAVYLAHKGEEGFIDFIGRNPTNPVGPVNPTPDKPNYTLIIILVAACIVVIVLVAIIVPVSVHKLKQKKANKNS